MKIFIKILIILFISNSFGQVEFDIYFFDKCKQEIRKLDFILFDFDWNYIEINSKNNTIDSLGTYQLFTGLEIKNGDYSASVSKKLDITKNSKYTDTVNIPKLRFVTSNEMHSSYWNYFYCSDLCDGYKFDNYPNGNMRIEGVFVKGKPTEIKHYRENGTLESEEYFNSGDFEPYRKNEYDELEELSVYTIRKKLNRKIITRTYDHNDNLIDESIQRL